MHRVVLLSVLIAAAGCGSSSSRPGGGSGSRPPVQGAPDPYGDPPAYGGDPFAGFGGIVSIAVPGGTVQPAEPAAPGGRFSVQVAACSTPDAAAALVEELRGLLEQQVFVDHQGGYHKVRVGSLDTREQADSLQASVRALGYPEAWVVEREP